MAPWIVYRGKQRDRISLRFALAPGRRFELATDFLRGQEAEALAFGVEEEERIRAAKARPSPAALTVRAWGEQWVEERRVLGKATWRDERGRLRHHLYPELGGRRLLEVTKAEMMAWVLALPRRKTVDAHPRRLSKRYVHNLANLVKQLFEDAVERDLIPLNPCGWKARKHLPPKVDADPERRLTGGYTAADVAKLVSDSKVPEDRRVLYALEFLTGMRPGEAAARRWRDLDATTKPLGTLTAATAWSTPLKRVKGTKTNVMKLIPVHPRLAELLKLWRMAGWERFAGRPPKPEDLIVPAAGGGPRNNSYSNRLFRADAKRLELRVQRHYETRSTFRSLALAGGALVEDLDRITHPSPKRAADLYDRRATLWPATCRAVLAIELPALEAPAGAPRLVAVAGVQGDVQGDTPAADEGQGSLNRPFSGLKATGAVGGRARESNPPTAPLGTIHRF